MAKIFEQKMADRVPKTRLEKILTHEINQYIKYADELRKQKRVLMHDLNISLKLMEEQSITRIHNDDVNMMKGGTL